MALGLAGESVMHEWPTVPYSTVCTIPQFVTYHKLPSPSELYSLLPARPGESCVDITSMVDFFLDL